MCMKITNMIIDKISEDYAFLSDKAKNYLNTNLEEYDIYDFERLLCFYQLEKEPDTEDDIDDILINNLIFLTRLLLQILS